VDELLIMPFTPFHLGPVVLLWSLSLSLDIGALVLGATLMDIEGLLYLFHLYPVTHGALHSILGATLTAIVAMFLSYEIQLAFDSQFKEKGNVQNIMIGGLFGAYSHLALDACLYDDLNLAWPLKWWNPLFGTLDSFSVVVLCVVTFVLGVIVIVIRRFSKKEDE
jgi:membrane-bound metal-dependent hydrolase YbcI (DUF457 family)